MRLGGGPIPRGRASEDRDLMSYRVKQEFLKVTHHIIDKRHRDRLSRGQRGEEAEGSGGTE